MYILCILYMYCYLLASSLLVDKGEEEREERERERERWCMLHIGWLGWLLDLLVVGPLMH